MKLAAVVTAIAVSVPGCGAEPVDANEVLSETAANLGEIRSAERLRVHLLVDPPEGEAFGFEVDGAFACGDERLPRLDVEYTQRAQGEEETVVLVATGDRAWVVVEGEPHELSAEQAEPLAGTCAEVTGGGLTTVPVDEWVVDAEGERRGDVDRVTGKLDVVAVVEGLGDVARAFGNPGLPRLDRDDAQRLREATRETRFELESGAEDRLLRRLLLEAEIGLDVPRDLRRTLGDVAGGTFTFELELDGPNEQIEIDRPE